MAVSDWLELATKAGFLTLPLIAILHRWIAWREGLRIRDYLQWRGGMGTHGSLVVLPDGVRMERIGDGTALVSDRPLANDDIFRAAEWNRDVLRQAEWAADPTVGWAASKGRTCAYCGTTHAAVDGTCPMCGAAR